MPFMGVHEAFSLRSEREEVLAELMFTGILKSLHDFCKRRRANVGLEAGRLWSQGPHGADPGDSLLKLRMARPHQVTLSPGAGAVSGVCPIRVHCRPSANPGHRVCLT